MQEIMMNKIILIFKKVRKKPRYPALVAPAQEVVEPDEGGR
jgi:hypothetical protein